MDGNSGRTNGDLVGDETKMVITRCRYIHAPLGRRTPYLDIVADVNIPNADFICGIGPIYRMVSSP